MGKTGKAARAIIIEDDKCLVMHRDKYNSKYFTLVGGRLNDGETPEQALVREVKEETGLTVTAARMVFIEEHHSADFNDQYIFLCNVAPHDKIEIQTMSEEGFMNRIGINVHTPLWAEVNALGSLPFRTPTLQKAIIHSLSHGWPTTPIKL